MSVAIRAKQLCFADDPVTFNLPDDVDALRAIIVTQARELAEQTRRLQARNTLIETLKAQLASLRRSRLGASSEKIDRAIEQLELALEEIEASASEGGARIPVGEGVQRDNQVETARQSG